MVRCASDIALRERTLWRLLYETAARADEVRRLDVEDLGVAGKGARTRPYGTFHLDMTTRIDLERTAEASGTRRPRPLRRLLCP
jgi:integrase